MAYDYEDFLTLSGIQHFAFCRRQWALIHIESQWRDNYLTTAGSLFHANAHGGLKTESRGNTLITRSLPVFSRTLGINGVCDIVEFTKSNDGIEIFGRSGKWLPTPIEYKKGLPKEDDRDKLQLLAQAVCLEEMLMCEIKSGYLYYGETKHRLEVVFTPELRKRLFEITEEMHKYCARGFTPRVKKSKKCKACSLNKLCLPEMTKYASAKKFISDRIKEADNASD